MRKRMKKCLLLLISALLLAGLCGFNSTEDKVYDEAWLFSNQEKAALQQKLVEKAQEIGYDMIIVTTLDNEGKSSEAYADDFYDEHGFGYEKKNGSGILLLIDMDARNYQISTAGKAIEQCTDWEIEQILDAMESDMRSGDYYDACLSFIDSASYYLTGGEVAENGHYDPVSGEFVEPNGWDKVLKPGFIFGTILVCAILAGIVVLILAHNSKTKVTVSGSTYMARGSQIFHDKRDLFTHTSVVKRKIETENRSGGGGGHSFSSSHTSSGGHSHGGGGRGF